MKLEKAIEVLAKFDKGQYPGSAIEFRKAVKLGNEALKRFQQWRFVKSHLASELLPGETPEEE